MSAEKYIVRDDDDIDGSVTDLDSENYAGNTTPTTGGSTKSASTPKITALLMVSTKNDHHWKDDISQWIGFFGFSSYFHRRFY